MWGRVYRNTWWQWDPSLLRSANGAEEVGPLKAEAKAEERKILFQTANLNLNLLLLLEVRNDESAWEEISLFGMWDRNTLYESQ
jgi:hypothetical protein